MNQMMPPLQQRPIEGLPEIPSYEIPARHELPANRVSWQPDPARGALLVHDLQLHFLEVFAEGADTGLIAGVLQQIACLIGQARTLGVPVIYSAQPPIQSPEQRGLLSDMWGPGIVGKHDGAAIHPQVAPSAQDIVLTKWRYSAFAKTELAERLALLGRDQLYITGIYAHIGCQATACDAFMRDIKAFMVRDALADFSRSHHQEALAYVATRCGAVIDTDQLFTASPTAVGAQSERGAETLIIRDIADTLGLSPEEVEPGDDLRDLGLDSIRFMAVIEAWSNRSGVVPDMSELASCETVEALLAQLETCLEEDSA